MSRQRLFQRLAPLWALALAGCIDNPDGAVEPPTPEVRVDEVHDGRDAAAGDRLFVGMFGNKRGQTTCSGIILGPRCVLTAAHCEVQQDYKFSNLNSPNTAARKRWAKVLRTLDHPGFARAGRDNLQWYDLKLVWFAKPEDGDREAFGERDWTPVRWSSRGAPRRRTPVEIIGYGANRRGPNGMGGFLQIGGGVKRRGQMRVSGADGPRRGGVGGSIALTPDPSRAGHFDSGGPIMAGGLVVGVVSREAWGAQHATATAPNASFINQARVFCQPGTKLKVSHSPARVRRNNDGTELRPGKINGSARAERRRTQIIECGPTVNPMNNAARTSKCEADLAGGRRTSLVAVDGRDHEFLEWRHGDPNRLSCPCAAGIVDADATARRCEFDSDDYVDKGEYAKKGIHCVAHYREKGGGGVTDGGDDGGGSSGGEEGKGEGESPGEGGGDGQEGEGEGDPGGEGEGEVEPPPDGDPCPNIVRGNPCPPPAEGEGEGEGECEGGPLDDPHGDGCGWMNAGLNEPCFDQCFEGERWCDGEAWGECVPTLPYCDVEGCDWVGEWGLMCPDCVEGELWPCDAGECRMGEMSCLDGRWTECVDLGADCAAPECCGRFAEECGFEDPQRCGEEPPPDDWACPDDDGDGMTDCEPMP